MEKSEKTMALAAKKLAIQMVIETATKDTANPFFKSKYADLCEVVNTIKKAMVDSGKHLLIEQFPHTAYGEPGKAPIVTVNTRITDVESGEFESFPLSALPKEDTPQAIGSTITYLRRYSLMPVFGVVPEDDDGNSASGKKDDGMDQRPPADRRPTQPPANRQPTTPAATAPATNPRPTSRTMRGRGAPAAAPEQAPQGASDDLPWPADAPEDTKPNKAPPLPNKNRLISKEEYLSLNTAMKDQKIIAEKMFDWMEREFGKRDPRTLSASECGILMTAITNTPEIVNQGIGF